MPTHPYLSFSDSLYKKGGKVVGTSNHVSDGNALIDPNIKEIQIPSSFGGSQVIEIGYDSFRGTKITKVYIPNTILYINRRSFYKCIELTADLKKGVV